MILTAWILTVFFGIFALWTSVQYICGRTLGWFHVLMWFFSVIVTAVGVGVIFGGLFKNLI